MDTLKQLSPAIGLLAAFLPAVAFAQHHATGETVTNALSSSSEKATAVIVAPSSE